jgi:hypothetical protein
MKKIGIWIGIGIAIAASCVAIAIYYYRRKADTQTITAAVDIDDLLKAQMIAALNSSKQTETPIKQERDVGGTNTVCPINALMQFENVQITKTSDHGVIGIELSNGGMIELTDNGDQYQKSAESGRFLKINLTITGGATYKYVGSIFD